MKLNIFLFLLLFPSLGFGQTNPPPPPAPAAPSPQEDFGTTQNSIMGTQSRSFGGGSIIKPNQILNSADFVLVGSPTYETFKFRSGTSLGWGKTNQGKGYGINAVLTFDLSKWKPEAFITLCSPYYDIGKNFFDKSNTFNTVVGNNVSLKISKSFNFNICWRMNINTTPRWGVMHNILLGTTLGF